MVVKSSLFTLSPSVLSVGTDVVDSLFSVGEGSLGSGDGVDNGSEFGLEVGKIGLSLGKLDG